MTEVGARPQLASSVRPIEEENGRQNGRRTCQRIGLSTTCHEATAAANAQGPALRALEQHDDHKGNHHHQVDDDQYSLHDENRFRWKKRAATRLENW
jgi:hypothetical protein